ncbi:hypothetical protein UFOVP71_51 [uncultured Caudovirales phage]|uniref:Uncharacterized protein n=1 Tax=uncultured Caudovirales phage TaxID=2100421 RepID=A0A6J5T9Q0_9CAUD|nr:hypothetical protein UFOVP71_51 [uncultured Caudovirales phage]
MSTDHEEWLRKQGVKITGRHTLRRATMPGFGWMKEDEPVEWASQTFTHTESVYQVELDERTIGKFERLESTVKYALEYMDRKHGGQRTPAPSNDVADYYIDNKQRHLELLKENSMYRDAWKEFQSIRVLLGETPHWP